MNSFLNRLSRNCAPFALAAFVCAITFSAQVEPKAAKKPGADAVRDFALLDHQGAFRQLYYHVNDPDTRALVLFVQGNGCPLVRKRAPELKRLRETYAAKGVRFWMLNANLQDTREEVAKEAAEFGFEMPILMDTAQLAARDLGISRTAEVILIDPSNWQIRYRGAIDDWVEKLGQKKVKARVHYLEDAIKAYLENKSVPVKKTPPVGCLINEF